MTDVKHTRPSDYERLSSTRKAIIDDHIRAGVEPPKFSGIEEKYTPGPWRADADRTGAFSIELPDGAYVCSRNPWDHRANESIANARLIAAAPDLLEALCALYEFVSSRHVSVPDVHYRKVTMAAAAIAKASGETP